MLRITFGHATAHIGFSGIGAVLTPSGPKNAIARNWVKHSVARHHIREIASKGH
jgi:hypothetical protein